MKIIDTIIHKNKYDYQTMYVVDMMPKFIYEQKMPWLIGEDSGFFNFYFHETPSKGFKAFAGREFAINTTDGPIKANGQWWDGLHPEYDGLLTSAGIGTIEGLAECSVFTSVWIDKELVKHTIKPSNNIRKYDPRHKDYGKHRIVSPWE